MFCPKCGAENNNGSAFCKKCGAQLSTTAGVTAGVETVHTAPISQPSQNKGKKIFKIIAGIVALIVVLVIIGNVASSSNSKKYIDFVKEGSPESYPYQTYGEAYDDFFSDPSWEYFESTDGEDVVEFTGDCQYEGADVTVTMQFILDVDNGTFEAGYFDMNGVPQSQLMTAGLLSAVFED